MSEESHCAIHRCIEPRWVPVFPHLRQLRRPNIDIPTVSVPLVPAPPHAGDEAYISQSAVADGWTARSHPDGSFYVHNPAGHAVADPALELKVLGDATIHMRMLWDRLERELPDLDHDSCELFLRVEPLRTSYYFARWDTRTVFWLDYLVPERPISSGADLANQLQYLFWIHVGRFPSHRPLPHGSLREIKGLMTFNLSSVVAKPLSPSLFSASDAAAHLQALQCSEISAQETEGGLAAVVALLWTEICRVRRNNLRNALFGAEGRKMFQNEPPRRVYQLIGLLLLFNEPRDIYLGLTELFVEQTMYERFWRNLYKERLRDEWKDQAFMATVNLDANMAFLAIGDISRTGGMYAVMQSLSLCSTLLAIGSIVFGRMLPSLHRRFQTGSAKDVYHYILSFGNGGDGPYKLAMLFSLPFALFTWSLVLFLGALLSFAFHYWTWASGTPVCSVSAVRSSSSRRIRGPKFEKDRIVCRDGYTCGTHCDELSGRPEGDTAVNKLPQLV
ncbi:hypothetical protein AURDEDRAFT_168156 [Auricularia subglabra TFB-10046 SS5]|nr:hypothetical protein AURDEDRAFT_168156 [Auricularia subglabra TFB-10046 SS5]